jgi:hypothetical protein
MLFGANAFRISGHKLKTEDSMQQCYMPCGRLNNNSPATGSRQGTRCTDGFVLVLSSFVLATGTLPFRGDTSAVIFKVILDGTPTSAMRLNHAKRQ